MKRITVSEELFSDLFVRHEHFNAGDQLGGLPEVLPLHSVNFDAPSKTVTFIYDNGDFTKVEDVECHWTSISDESVNEDDRAGDNG